MESEFIRYLGDVEGTWGPWIPMAEWICAIPATAARCAIGYTIGPGLGMVKDTTDLQMTSAITLAGTGPRSNVAWLRGVCGTPARVAS